MIAEIEASKSKIVDTNKDQAKKRKRNTAEGSTAAEAEKDIHSTGNGKASSLVAAHYNARQDAGRDARKQSPIIDLKTFNNWVKSVLIQQYGQKGGRVFDIGGGKGGDLKKWDKCGIRELVLADIAEVSVSQARDRFMDQRHRFKAEFFAMDCFGEPVEDHVPANLLSPLFDTVSLQFCLHYGWDNYAHADLMLDNIAKYLKAGGTFIATFPDCYELHSRLTEAVARDPSAKSFGNTFYNVSFDEVNRTEDNPIHFEPFGQRYTFALTDAIDEVAEFVVDWRELEEMARKKGLRCTYHGNFANFWQEFGLQGGPFRNLADRFGIRINQEIPMNEDLWGAVTIYAAVAFVKE
ncbi:mRNA capping enzyme, large subunit [Meira miltonrushii]|uniref:mRNA cap guanine-N(7) methyltransferase n=1 Tax=Meira miltonrushii TaxID=1280837 RepID=A0A316VF25_9BASI|nr:mRNA capping enzyme, large subunit [Meira miltonrushii]PWN35914.1 mRNA capping enzyme, large subunit [Meira miltonrushii]